MSAVVGVKRGTFQLARTLENPKPNKRNGRDWTCAPEWKAGTYFVIEDWYGSDRDNPIACIRLQHRDSKDLVETDDRFWLIARHLTPVAEQPSDYLARTRNADSANAVLDYLAEAGKITLHDVEQAMAGLIERWVAEDKEATARAEAKRAAKESPDGKADPTL